MGKILIGIAFILVVIALMNITTEKEVRPGNTKNSTTVSNIKLNFYTTIAEALKANPQNTKLMLVKVSEEW